MASGRVDGVGPPAIPAGCADGCHFPAPVASRGKVASDSMIRVILEGLVKRFGTVAAVDGVSLELRPGEMTYVLGPAGSGKTTLARLVTGLETLDDGEIYFGDRMVQALPAHERRVGMVFDDLGLWPGLTVLENVGFPLKAQKVGRVDRRRRVGEALSALRIDSLASRRPDQLTPQQRLRTALARARHRARPAGSGRAAGAA